MTEVVTYGAAFTQPFLQAHKPQALGVSNPESPQVDLQIAAEASRQNAAVAATQVAHASDDRSSLQQDSNTRGGQGFQPRARANDAPREVPAAPAGPSKARVEVPPQLLQAPAPQPKAPEPQAQARAPQPAPAPQPAAPVQAAVATPAPAKDAPAPAAPPVDIGALNNAEQLNTVALEAVAQNIVGVAFAPVQVAAAVQDGEPSQPQKNFIFSQRKLFAESEQPGKFAAEEHRRVVRETVHETPKFAAETAHVVASAVTAGRFAAETSQKVAEKFAPDQRGAGVEDTTGETRLYDKVSESQTQGRFAPEDEATQDERRASRESLYQRAAKIANALGEKAENPAVRKLFADIERYAAQVGGLQGTTAAAVVSPSVIVTA